MAEHLRHQFARGGLAVRPSQVTTFAGFLETRAPAAPSKFLLHFAIDQALANLGPGRFTEVARYRGFRESIARLIEEAPPEIVPADLETIFREVHRILAAKGTALRSPQLDAAAGNPGDLPRHIVFDGFFSFSRAELNLIAALAQRTAVTVTLPNWPGASAVCRDLLSRGFNQLERDEIRRHAAAISFGAPSAEREVEEISRRILDEAKRGKLFRELGIVVRAKTPYTPLIGTVLTRFGIPFRSYFANPLIEHPAVAHLAAVVRALLAGWDHQELLTALRLGGIDDHFDFELRKLLPGKGLPIRGIENPPEIVQSLVEIDSWRRDSVESQEWANRLKTRIQLDKFEEVLDDVAAAIGAGAITLEKFWRQVETALEVEVFRIPDHRRNVVHVMDVFEARQWELPVVFVCGLVEGHFPQHYRQDPLLKLTTAAEWQEREKYLLEFATTRATEKTILSYPRYPRLQQSAERCETRVRPRPVAPVSMPVPAAIQDARLLANLAKTHKALAATSIESFLQCPFQFFGRKTLRLRPRPKNPRDRLDVLLQGNIMHHALAEHSRAPLLGSAVFDAVFEDECRRARIPASYRTEAVRLEMFRHFEAFLADEQAATGWNSRVEEEFSFALNPLLTLRGRIDRLEIGPQNQALVIDYKYSAGNKIRERTDEDAAGNRVQGGIYLLAAERQFNLKPAGMLYCGLKKGVAWGGWHAAIPGLDGVGQSVPRSALDDMTRAAAAKAMETFEAISSGKIAAQPADKTKCAWCDFEAICRVESLGVAKTASR